MEGVKINGKIVGVIDPCGQYITFPGWRSRAADADAMGARSGAKGRRDEQVGEHNPLQESRHIQANTDNRAASWVVKKVCLLVESQMMKRMPQ